MQHKALVQHSAAQWNSMKARRRQCSAVQLADIHMLYIVIYIMVYIMVYILYINCIYVKYVYIFIYVYIYVYICIYYICIAYYASIKICKGILLIIISVI